MTARRTFVSPHPGPLPAEEGESSALLIAGPTAVGKSEIALTLAGRVGGEIISVDSMQVYRGLDIGTAKPSAVEQNQIPHHLIDVVDLTTPFDAARFVALAKPAALEIQSRHRTPVFCGGTGLYFKAYLDGLGDSPPANATLRAEIEATPPEELLRELEQRDPATFTKIDTRNLRRVVRAVEVIRLTGKKFSEQRAEWNSVPSSKATLFGLAREAADLRERINRRVDEMFARGLVKETRELLKCGLEQNRTAMQAIGYRQVVEHLRGERSLEETLELVKIKTRQFAKRQMTWFRRQLNVEWIRLDARTTAASAVEQILARWQK